MPLPMISPVPDLTRPIVNGMMTRRATSEPMQSLLHRLQSVYGYDVENYSFFVAAQLQAGVIDRRSSQESDMGRLRALIKTSCRTSVFARGDNMAAAVVACIVSPRRSAYLSRSDRNPLIDYGGEMPWLEMSIEAFRCDVLDFVMYNLRIDPSVCSSLSLPSQQDRVIAAGYALHDRSAARNRGIVSGPGLPPLRPTVSVQESTAAAEQFSRLFAESRAEAADATARAQRIVRTMLGEDVPVPAAVSYTTAAPPTPASFVVMDELDDFPDDT
jgi:hypothetical protein